MSIELYRQFRRQRRAQPFTGKFMPYDWGGLSGTVNGIWMTYELMFKEFSRELANAVNAFTNRIEDLAAWAAIAGPLSDERKMRIAHEFVDVLGTMALTAPYMLRSRFIFAAAHMCHQANIAKDAAWKDDLPLDGEIYMAAADKYGAGWRRYNRLKTRLEAIAGKGFNKATHDFRHAYNHRFSARFMVGITQFVTREVNEGSGAVRYAFGGVPPLELDAIVPILRTERDRCYAAFEAFQALVREHEAVIAAGPPK